MEKKREEEEKRERDKLKLFSVGSCGDFLLQGGGSEGREEARRGVNGECVYIPIFPKNQMKGKFLLIIHFIHFSSYDFLLTSVYKQLKYTQASKPVNCMHTTTHTREKGKEKYIYIEGNP